MDAADIGTRVQNMIEDRDMTQVALAEKIGVHQNTLNGYLKGKHRFPQEIIAPIAKALNISTDYIFGLTDIPDPPMRISKSEQLMIQTLRSLYRDQQEAVHNQIQFFQKQNQRE